MCFRWWTASRHGNYRQAMEDHHDETAASREPVVWSQVVPAVLLAICSREPIQDFLVLDCFDIDSAIEHRSLFGGGESIGEQRF